MRRDLSKPYVTWTARVAEAERDRLHSLLPMNGGTSWALNAGLELFLEVCERDPVLVASTTATMQRAFSNPQPIPDSTELVFRITTRNYSRFNLLWPQQGGTTWMVRQLLAAAISAYEHVNLAGRLALEIAILQETLMTGAPQ